MSTSASDAAAGGCPFAHAAAAGGPTGSTGPTGCPVSAGAAAFDPFGDGYQQDPPAYLRWSRAEEPVFWSPQLGYWVVTRFDDVKAIFRDHLTFIAGPRACVGASLARVEIREVVRQLLERAPHVRLDPDAPPPVYKGLTMRRFAPLNVLMKG